MGLARSQVQAYNLISIHVSKEFSISEDSMKQLSVSRRGKGNKLTKNHRLLTSVKSRQKVIIALNITEKCKKFGLTQYQNTKALIKQLPCTAYKCCLNN
jgi:hypothetical protein